MASINRYKSPLGRVKKRALDAKHDELRSLLDIKPENLTKSAEARADALVQEIETLAAEADDAEDAYERANASGSGARAAGMEPQVGYFPAEVRGGGAAETAAFGRSFADAVRSGYTPRAHVVREERQYMAHKAARPVDEGGTSFFSDAYRYSLTGDPGARQRLERHAQEVEREGEMSKRAVSTGGFAGLVVPQYLVEQAALIARAGRPIADHVLRLQIPDQGTVFQVPRGTTGASAAIQATENTNVSSTDEVWTNVQVNVLTGAGQQDVSRQSLERGTPGLDSLVYNDLAGAYGVMLDTQVISGTGTGQKGLLNAGGTQATAFTAAVTAATFQLKVAGAANSVASNRYLTADTIAMHPRRWAWLTSLVDSSNRPLVLPEAQGPYNAPGVGGLANFAPGEPGFTFQGLRVVLDANLPTAQGTGPEDIVFVYRSDQAILWEDGDGMPKMLRFEQTLGNQLTVKLVAYNYFAFTAERYPLATSIVGGNATVGNGLIAPTF